MKKLAVIDIGSNTVLITGGTLDESGRLITLFDRGEVARLSEGLRDGEALREEAKERVLRNLRAFRELARSHGVSEIYAAGTAAFRRASDGENFARRIEAELGIPVRILSGDEEAYYSYQSARSDFGEKSESIGMIDIGGGSTELVFGEGGFQKSLPIGTVRLQERHAPTHPIDDEVWKRIQGDIRGTLEKFLPSPCHSREGGKPDLSTAPAQNLDFRLDAGRMPSLWVAVAATPASLASVYLRLPEYDPAKVHGLMLSTDTLADLVETIRQKTLAERLAMPGLHPDRAELIPVGGAILVESLRFLGLEGVTISDRGLRYGLLEESLRSRSS